MAVPVLSFNSRHQQKCSQSFSSLIIPRTLPAQLLPPVETSPAITHRDQASSVPAPTEYALLYGIDGRPRLAAISLPGPMYLRGLHLLCMSREGETSPHRT